LERVDDLKSYLSEKAEINALKAIEKHERSGRPLGSSNFIKELEEKLGIQLFLKNQVANQKLNN
jgi:hypothetical protein